MDYSKPTRLLPRFRLSVTECTLSKNRKPNVETYEYYSIFDAIEAFLSTPKRFQPSITKITDLDEVSADLLLRDIFEDENYYKIKSFIK